MKYLIIFCFAISSGVCVVPVEKGEVAPVGGFIFTPEEEQSLRLKNEQNKAKIIKLEDLGKIDEQIIKEQQSHIKALNSPVNNTWLWFALGVLTTSLGVYVGSKASK
jgi:hypothetical protein